MSRLVIKLIVASLLWVVAASFLAACTAVGVMLAVDLWLLRWLL